MVDIDFQQLSIRLRLATLVPCFALMILLLLHQDDLGFVYHTDNTGVVYGRDPDTANLDILALTFSGPLGNNLQPAPEALAFKRLGGVPYLYACSADNAAVSRLRINYDGSGKPASFSPASPIPINTPFGCRGVTIEDDGTLYYTGIAAPNTGRAAHFVAKVCAQISA
jgi:hypothetical protein